MKKILLGLLIAFFAGFSYNVYAEDFQIKELIPIETKASVQADLFIYSDIKYLPAVNNNGLGLMTFRSIQNLSNKRIPISINVLFFDVNKKNIGFMTYCSEKDIDSDYANFKIDPLANHVFAINVTTKYFVDDKTPLDTKYYSIFDDNQYCKIGGYSKYKGMTIEEILKTLEKKDDTSSNNIIEILKSFLDSSWAKMIFWLVLGIIVLSVTGNILNRLYYQLYKTNTNLVYIPFVNYYISMKLAFGGVVALGFGIVMLLAILLWFLKINFLIIIVHILGIISFVVVIIKLITKNSDLLFFEKNIDVNDDKKNDKFFNNLDDDVEEEEVLVDDHLSVGNVDEKEMRRREKELEKEKKRKEKERRKKEKLEKKLKKDVNYVDSNKSGEVNSVLDLEDFNDNFGGEVKKSDDTINAIEELELKYDSYDSNNTSVDLNLDDDDDDK